MDALVAAAARALAVGDTLGALGRVALRDDAPALALRGIAMARLGDLPRARELLRRAGAAFGPRETLSRARCTLAEAEVSLALRDLSDVTRGLDAAIEALASRGDRLNAAQGALVAARQCVLVGDLPGARARLSTAGGVADGDGGASATPASMLAVLALTQADLALRELDVEAARRALSRAADAAASAGIAALEAEAAAAWSALQRVAARSWQGGASTPLRLDAVAALFASGACVVDTCRRGVARGGHRVGLATRPVLFALVQVLAEAWPGEATRERLIERAFRTRHHDETHRARLRVELGRLRRLLAPLVRIEAGRAGYALRPPAGVPVALLLPPDDGAEGALLALLADGAAWPTSALALATASSQRSVQRSLASLLSQGRVRSVGRGRTRRWLAPPAPGITTILLLPATLPAA